jgi:hypothetical protein
MIRMRTIKDMTIVSIEVVEPVTETILAAIDVTPKPYDLPGNISWEASHGIHPDYVDEIVTALYDARRIAKGTLKVL